jgi:hypothetical protein
MHVVNRLLSSLFVFPLIFNIMSPFDSPLQN